MQMEEMYRAKYTEVSVPSPSAPLSQYLQVFTMWKLSTPHHFGYYTIILGIIITSLHRRG